VLPFLASSLAVPVVASLAVTLSASAPTGLAPAGLAPAGRAPTAVVAAGAPTFGARPRWVAPLRGSVRVIRAFDLPAKPWLPGHRGVDLSAVPGDVVLAAGGGTVTWASELAGRGVVVVQHPDGRRTTYEPVTALVSEGDTVSPGDPIGILATGDSHCGRLPSCLHWGLRRDRAYLDPMRLIDPGRPVLLPP
jgi:murein DD-endopeptidase MepM/ murein hydrolase activator NlpD